MVIKGTEKIKGVLDLSSVGLQLKKGAVYSISDNDFWNSDIQSALKMGFLSSAGDPTQKGDDSKKVVRCINSYHRPITLNSVSAKEVMPNHSFTLPESKLNDPDIRVAISKGMITVTQVIDPNSRSEGFLELGSLFAKESKKSPKNEEQTIKQSPNTLETNEEIDSLGKVVDETESEKEIVWNPSGKKKVVSFKDAMRTQVDNEDQSEILKPRKEPEGTHTGNVISDPNPAPVQAEDDKKRQTVVINPHKSRVTNTAKSYVWNAEKQVNDEPQQKLSHKQIDDILFVDEKQEKEKIASHPILSKKQIVEEIDDPIIPDPVTDRIAKHPVLSKKQQNEEIDFVEG